MINFYRLGGREFLRSALSYLTRRINCEGWIFDQTTPNILRDMIELDPSLARQLIPGLLRQVADGGERAQLVGQALFDARQNSAARSALETALRDQDSRVRDAAASILRSDLDPF